MKNNIVAAFVIAIVVFGILRATRHEPKADINQTVVAMNAQLKPPVVITDGLRLDSITGVGTSIVAKYTALNYSGFDLPGKVNQILKVSMVKAMCDSALKQPPQMLEYLEKQHISFSAKFYNNTGMILSTFEAKAEDCR